MIRKSKNTTPFLTVRNGTSGSNHNKGKHMRYIQLAVLAMFLTACTYSINMVHTEGMATDVVDETATPTATTDISVPISGL